MSKRSGVYNFNKIMKKFKTNARQVVPEAKRRRDAKHIEQVLSVLRKTWKKHTDLRLGQLLMNCANDGDLYFVEDQMMIDMLSKYNNYGRKK